MKQRYLNLILCVFALGLVVAVLLTQKKAPPRGAPLTTLSADAVSHIAIRHPEAAEIDLEKKDGRWALTAPVHVAADPVEIANLSGLASAETHSVIDDPAQVNLKDLGLDPPAFSVNLNDTVLDFGNVEPLRYQRYVRVGGRIALIDDPSAEALDAHYADLVAKRLLPEAAEIAKIEVPGLVVTRAAGGSGWVAQPEDATATSDALQKFADAWQQARAGWNLPVVTASKPDPGATVAVTLASGETLRYAILSRSPQLILERPDIKVRYSLPQTAVEQLLKLPAAPPAPTAGSPANATRPAAEAPEASSKPEAQENPAP